MGPRFFVLSEGLVTAATTVREIGGMERGVGGEGRCSNEKWNQGPLSIKSPVT